MQHEVLDKLRAVLSGPIDTEPLVVYVMVEVRKVIEHLKESKQYPELWFFCNWTLHTKIDQEVPAILRELELIIDQILQNPESSSYMEPLSKAISLGRLRRALKGFASAWALPTAHFDDPLAWQQFSRLYAEVVREMPLGSKNAPLKGVLEFRITRDRVREVYGQDVDGALCCPGSA